MNLPTSPTDPLDVLTEQAVRAIRRHVTGLRARVAQWEPRPQPITEPDPAPAYGLTRPTRRYRP